MDIATSTGNSVGFSTTISLLALGVSFLALGWNIVRDLIKDRVKVELRASVGGAMGILGHPGGFFRDADSSYTPPNPQIAYCITNTGRHPVVITKIEGTYKVPKNQKTKWVLGSVELPKTLNPYEFVMSISNDDNFLKELTEDNIGDIWALDTKGKKWKISTKGMERLKHTAAIVAAKK